MTRLRIIMTLTAIVLAAGGCASTKINADPRICALVGGVIGGTIGGTWAADNHSGDDAGPATAGAVGGGAAGAGLGYLLCQREEVAPPPAPAPPPEPAPQPPRTEAPKQRIVLRGVNFDFDSAAIRTDAEVILDAAAEILRENASATVRIEGHTCSMGTDEYNQGLSERRAKAVMDYLVNSGIEASRLSSTGFGESQPVADNATRDGRAQNRRVELEPLE